MANTVFRVHERILHRVLLVIGFLTFVVCYIYNFPSSLLYPVYFRISLALSGCLLSYCRLALLVVSFSGFL